MSNVDSISSGRSTQRKAEFECEDDIPSTNKPCIDFQPDDRWHIKEEETTDSTMRSDTDAHDRVIERNKANSEEMPSPNEHLKIQHKIDHKKESTAFNGDISIPVCAEDKHVIMDKIHHEDCATSNKLKDSLDIKQSVIVGEPCSEQDPSLVCNATDTCSNSSSQSTSHEEEHEPSTFSSTTKYTDSTSVHHEHKLDTPKQSINVEKTSENEEKVRLKTYDVPVSNESASCSEAVPNERQSVIRTKLVIKTNTQEKNELKSIQANEKDGVHNGQESSTDSVWCPGLSGSPSNNSKEPQKTISLDKNVEIKISRDDKTQVVVKKEDFSTLESKAKIDPETKSKTDLENSKMKIESEDSSSMSRDSELGHQDDALSKSDEKSEGNSSALHKTVKGVATTCENKKNSENSTIKTLLSTSQGLKKPSAEKSVPKPESEENREGAGGSGNLSDTKTEIGKYSPIKLPAKGTLLIGKDDVILESPSFLVPLIVKEPNKYPRLEGEKPVTVKQFDLQKIFDSSAGQFLIGLGLSRVKEWYHKDMKKLKARQMRKQGKQVDLEMEYQEHKQAYLESKQANSPFSFPLRKCEICDFKTESKVVMEAHYSIPHLTSRKEYRCNYCTFCTRDPAAILLHFKSFHGKLASLELPMQYHECHFCPFQSHLKAKVNSHMNKCQKNFVSTHNQAPPVDFDFPTITAKPVTLVEIEEHKAFVANSAKASSVKITLAQQTGLQKGNGRKRLAAVLNKLTANQNAQLYKQMATSKSHTVLKPLIISQQSKQQAPVSQQHLQQVTPGGIQLPPGIVITRPRVPSNGRQNPAQAQIMLPRAANPVRQVISSSRKLVPLLNNKALAAANAPQISITPTTKVPSVATTPTTAAGQKQGGTSPQPVALFTNLALSGSSQSLGKSGVVVTVQSTKTPQSANSRTPRLQSPYQRHTAPPPHGSKGNSSGTSFVMCEICDAYIKDLEELRSHMQSVHKVKIHPKMLVSRPPLNCQKCQWRFFTDQGLERHLLGAHGLVTSNMQELANRNQDGGRCLICGAVFTYKLVNHMTLVHKVTLKPAHLSYKCTVCTATFALYRLFENHVYTIHSGAVKRLTDESSSQPNKKIKLSQPEKSVPAKQSESVDNDTSVDSVNCYHCGKEVVDLQVHLRKHLKKCTVKLCKIEKCQKCLCSFDGMLVLHTSDFGLDDEEEDDDDEEEEEVIVQKATNSEEKMDVDESVTSIQGPKLNLEEKEENRICTEEKNFSTGVTNNKQDEEEKMDEDSGENKEVESTKDCAVDKELQIKDPSKDEESHINDPPVNDEAQASNPSVHEVAQVKDSSLGEEAQIKDLAVKEGLEVKGAAVDTELTNVVIDEETKNASVNKESTIVAVDKETKSITVGKEPQAKDPTVNEESHIKDDVVDEEPLAKDTSINEEPQVRDCTKNKSSPGTDSLKGENS